jgi:exosome complex component CSL4
MIMDVGTKVAPGDRIGNAKELIPGAGCYQRGNHIFASAVGTININNNNNNNNNINNNNNQNVSASVSVVSITLEKGRLYASSQILSIGRKVLCKVGRIMNQQAMVNIVAAETDENNNNNDNNDNISALREHHGGLIRKEDVRLGATEEVKIHESFRPGDVVLARIISLGDSRRFYLSTAENELGVIRAICGISGESMVPISWKEMECPKTGVRERRKCAKPKDTNETN